MNRKNLLLLAVIIAGTLAIMAGCTSPQFGAPGTTGAAHRPGGNSRELF